jgi:hypothetical protein
MGDYGIPYPLGVLVSNGVVHVSGDVAPVSYGDDPYLIQDCGDPAISLHSYTVPLVQWCTRLLPVMRDLGSIPGGLLM